LFSIQRKSGDEKMPNYFPESGTQEEHVAYDKWCDDHLKVRSYMLASIYNKLQKKYETMEDARLIILTQRNTFVRMVEPLDKRSKALYFMRMVEGSSVNDHALKMIWHIEELARLNLIMDNKLAMDLIIKSLPNSFSSFVQNFNMHKMEKTLTELHSIPVVYEKECTTWGLM